MRLTIHAVGRLRSGPEQTLYLRYRDFAARAGGRLGLAGPELREHAESRRQTAGQRREEESGLILKALAAPCCLVVLDEAGDDIDSGGFAELIGRQLESGMPDMAFAIGGPDGHAAGIARRADRRIRFGAVTWPHRLVRIMLAEQVYRAITILSGHPYHRQ